MTARTISTILGLACFGYVVAANSLYMQWYKDYIEQQEQIVLVPEVDAIRKLPIDPRTVVRSALLGNEVLLADLLWVRAVHYLGGNYSTLTRPIVTPDGRTVYKKDNFINLIDTLHFLDPDFLKVYQFAAFVYQEFLREYDRACDELIAGFEQVKDPERKPWRFMYEAGFIQYWYVKDYDLAFEYCMRAAEVPNTPGFVERICYIYKSRSGQRAVALGYFQSKLAVTQDPIERQILERRIGALLNEVDQHWFERAMKSYLASRGQPPERVDLLLHYGAVHEVTNEIRDHTTGIADPRGNAFYVIVDVTGEASALYNREPGPQVMSTYDHFRVVQAILSELGEICVDFESRKGRPAASWDDLVQQYPDRVPRPPIDPLGLGEYRLLGGVPNFVYTTDQLTPQQRLLATQPVY